MSSISSHHHDAGKPERMGTLATTGLAPWSWCMTTGMCGYISTAASIRCRRKGSPAYLARTGGGLHDHRAGRLVGGLHDRLDLLEIVHIEARHAIGIFSGVVQQLSQRYESHEISP